MTMYISKCAITLLLLHTVSLVPGFAIPMDFETTQSRGLARHLCSPIARLVPTGFFH